jgi:hypothetical protein
MLSLFMQVILQDRKNLIILSVRDVASPHLFQYCSICIAAIYNISAFIANEQKMLSLFMQESLQDRKNLVFLFC